MQPDVHEHKFFDKIRQHLSRPELQKADKPLTSMANFHHMQAKKNHTPWSEFLKCLHLFAANIVSFDDLCSLARNLLIQGLALKSSLNTNMQRELGSEADALLAEFRTISKARKVRSQLGDKVFLNKKYAEASSYDIFQICDQELANLTPSYKKVPNDYLTEVQQVFSDRDSFDNANLNDVLVSVPQTKLRMNYDVYNVRKNQYETELFRLEDQRFELDRMIDVNFATIRQMEPVIEEIQTFKNLEEIDGQPLGRLQYKLKRPTFTTSHVGAISRLYGRHGPKIIEHLKTNPFAVLPIVMNGLKEKDAEWRTLRTECNLRWRELHGIFFRGTLNFNLERQKALYLSEWDSEYLCHEAVSRVDNNGGITFGDDDDVEEYVKEELKKQMELHRDAYALMSTYTASDAFENSPWRNDGKEISRLEISRVWLEFMMPFYDYPLEMVLGETHTQPNSTKNSNTTKIAALFPPNIRVKTCFGEGKIIKVIDEGTRKYQIQLDYGVAYLQGGSILGILGDQTYKCFYGRNVRSNKVEKISDGVKFGVVGAGANGSSEPYEICYLNTRMFVFVRQFAVLRELLSECREFVEDCGEVGENAEMEDGDGLGEEKRRVGEEMTHSEDSVMWLDQNMTAAERAVKKTRGLLNKDDVYGEGLMGALELVAAGEISELVFEDCCRYFCNRIVDNKECQHGEGEDQR